MKNIVLFSIAALCSTAVSAQTAFTVKSGEKKYAFPITSEITVTNDKLWEPEVIEVEKKFKSIYTNVEPKFETSFCIEHQKSETGVTNVEPARLIADNVWAIVFTTDEYKRVQMSVKLTPAPSSDRPLLANKGNVQPNLGACAKFGNVGNYFALKEFGKNGKWAWIYNELSNTYAMVSVETGEDGTESVDLSSLVAPKDFVEKKDVNIDNVTDNWVFKAQDILSDNKKDTLMTIKMTADPEYDKSFEISGIPYKVNTGRVLVKLCGHDIKAYFPDEWDIASGKNFEFKIVKDNTIALSGDNIVITAGSYIPDDNPANVYADEKATWDDAYFTIQDKNTLVSQNGMAFCRWKYNSDKTVKVLEKYTIPAGAKIRRESTYPSDAVQIVHDTVYVEKHDTVYVKEISVDDVIKAGKYAEETFDSNKGVYKFASDDEFKLYASYYAQAAKKEDSDIPDDKKKEWNPAVESLKKVATCYGYYSKKLMNPQTVGRYLMLGQGMVNAMTIQKTADIGEGTYYNGNTMGLGSGYVAYAKYDCDITDTEFFKESTAGKRFEDGGTQGAFFGGLTKVDVYVVYNPEDEGRYTPIYIAHQGNMIVEQWKGNTKNNYPTLEEAIQHFGCSSGNMQDRGWIKANWSDDAKRVVVGTKQADLTNLYAKYSDFSVVATGGSTKIGEMFTPGVTIDTSSTPFSFTKDGEACEFSGYAVLTAKNENGKRCEIVVTTINSSLYIYSYELAD